MQKLNFNFSAAIAKSSATALQIKSPTLTMHRAAIVEPAPATQAPARKATNPNTDFALEMESWCNDVHDASIGQLSMEL